MAADRQISKIEEVIKKYFGEEEKFGVSVKTSKGAMARIENVEILPGQTYKNEYYKGTKFEVVAEEVPGYDFKYFLVDGAKEETKKITVGSETTIEVVAEQKKNALAISRVAAKGNDDWFEITNVGSSRVNIGNYYVSDNKSDLAKYQLPDYILEPGKTMRIYGKRANYRLGDFVCNFGLKEGETLSVMSNGMVIDEFYIPRMEDGEEVGRDLSTGKRQFQQSQSVI